MNAGMQASSRFTFKQEVCIDVHVWGRKAKDLRLCTLRCHFCCAMRMHEGNPRVALGFLNPTAPPLKGGGLRGLGFGLHLRVWGVWGDSEGLGACCRARGLHLCCSTHRPPWIAFTLSDALPYPSTP